MAEMQSTYRAVQAVSPGKLELTEKPLLDPPAGHVRIRVEACGVCHSDSATVEGILPIQWPRVPGHEAVGRIDVISEGVEGWMMGQRVGVGFLGGSCGHCEFCRDGDLVNCKNQCYTGVQHDGGYAEVMIAKATGPDATLRFKRDERRRRHCRDHAARAGRGSLRQDDVRPSPLQAGSDDVLSARSGPGFTVCG